MHWDGEVLFQRSRLAAYREALERLRDGGWAYPCTCSRKDIAAIAAASPSAGKPGGRIYPGTCRNGPVARRRTRVLRARTSSEPIAVEDRLQGLFRQSLETDVGDFVLRRRDGLMAYQLAVVVDDAWQGITDVVRGVDLLDSTPRQVWLQRLLGYPTPRYTHLPVLVNPDGEKLSKQTGATPVDPGRASELAWLTLALLRQSPPPELRGGSPEEAWAWGAAHWRPQQIAGLRSIGAP